MKIETVEPRASIFTIEQETDLRRLKAYFPYRLVWGCVNTQTNEVTYHTSYDRRGLNLALKAGHLVATIG